MAKLIETSLWIDFLRPKSATALKARIREWLLDRDACLCEPVCFEILRLASPSERKLISAQFAVLPILETPGDLWSGAAKFGQRCRDHGITLGGVDLLIAFIAARHEAEIVTFDADFKAAGAILELRVAYLTREI